METVVYGIKETSPGVFRVTRNGAVLGDSRGYRRNEAISEARELAERNGGIDGDWVGSNWVEFRTILDPAL
jgi:hypothetical protein